MLIARHDELGPSSDRGFEERLADVSRFHLEPLGFGDAYHERRELSAHVANVLASARIENLLSILEFAMHTSPVVR
jgi:hypothetical protein